MDHLQEKPRRAEGNIREAQRYASWEQGSLAKKIETIWQIDPHTQSKHAILRRY